MFLYGALAYSENYGDLTVPFSLSHPMQYFRLACCEAKPRSKARWIELLLFRNRRACLCMERLVVRVWDHWQAYTVLRNFSLENCQENSIRPIEIVYYTAGLRTCGRIYLRAMPPNLSTGRAETLARDCLCAARPVDSPGRRPIKHAIVQNAYKLLDAVNLSGTNRETDSRGICSLISKKV
jgi:hypothetical protein